MERNKFIFYKDWWEALRQMPDEMSRSIIEAIMNYALYGIDTDNPQIAYSIYALAKAQIDRDTTKYDKQAERNRINGAKSKGAPVGNQNARKQPKQPTGLNSTQDNPNNPNNPKQPNNINIDNDNDNDNDKIKIEEEEEERARGKKTKDDEYAEQLLQDRIFWEQTAIAVGAVSLGWDISAMQDKVAVFVADMIKSVDDPSRDYAHFRNRFKGWLRAEADYTRRNIKKQAQTQQPKSPLYDFIRERLG